NEANWAIIKFVFMAGRNRSSRDLWQFIANTTVQRPEVLISTEIKDHHEKILKGLSSYQKPNKASEDKLKTEKHVKGDRFEFLKKLSRFINLNEVQCHDLFNQYLLREYTGSHSNLQTVLSDDRRVQGLLLKVRDFYHTDRLYLLWCLKSILCNWQDEDHPYRVQYFEFVEKANLRDELINSILQQYDNITAQQAPTWESHGQLMTEVQVETWIMQNLREQLEVLNLVLLFYKDFEHPPDKVYDLLMKFKRQGFGKRQHYRNLLNERTESLTKRIGHAQILIIIQSVDLEYLSRSSANDPHSQPLLQQHPKFKSLDQLFCSLGDYPQHGPLLITWSIVRQLLSHGGAAGTRKLGNTALQLGVFDYMLELVTSEPFNGNTMIAHVSQTVLYGLLSVLLTLFHEDTLGDTTALYQLVSKLLSHPLIAADMWDKGFDEGVGTLVGSALSKFPLDFEGLVHLMIPLAKASKPSSRRVCKLLSQMRTYTEFLDQNRAADIEQTRQESVWMLVQEKLPYNSGHFVIPRRTCGQLFPQPGPGSPLIQWEVDYSAWDLFYCEVNLLLEQISHGTGMVSRETVAKVTSIADLASEVMKHDIDISDQVKHLSKQFFDVVQRFIVAATPPLDLLSSCIKSITCLLADNPLDTWHQMKQTGILPFLTENFTDLLEATSGNGLNAGPYGTILAGFECTQGHYAVTLSLLDFMTHIIQPLYKARRETEMMACLVFLTRDIFPSFHKWRYFDITSREQIGQKCLELFHKILNTLGSDSQNTARSTDLSLRDVCVYSLLYTEAGRTLLEIISTGVDTIEVAIGYQGSLTEGGGVELIHMIRLALSVLNRLLLLRPAHLSISPVEHALSSQPANRSHRHVVATIAQYIYHYHDQRLPRLSTLLLKRLAMVSPMSIMACLGNDSEAIRDIYLARLQSFTEQPRLKVVILELLSECVDTQPGLIELFINVCPAPPDANPVAGTSASVDTTPPGLQLGRTSCLQAILDMFEERKQLTHYCPSELLCASLEFLHALWNGRRETAMAVLREKETFWRCVCVSIMRDLRPLKDNAGLPLLELKTCGFILRILAMELYVTPEAKLDKNLKKVLEDISSQKRLLYWSKYLRDVLQNTQQDDDVIDTLLAEHPVVIFLNSWRSLLIILASHSSQPLQIDGATKCQIMGHLLEGMKSQFASSVSMVGMNLASVSSALYLTLLKNWIRHIKDWEGTIKDLEELLGLSCSNSEVLIPPVQIGVLGALLHIVQYIKKHNIGCQPSVLSNLVGVVCDVLAQSTYQLVPPNPTMGKDDNNAIELKLKLQISCTCLLEELIMLLGGPESWLPSLQQHAILPSLLNSLETWLNVKQGLKYVQAVLMLFLTLSKHQLSAEALAVNGLTQHTCLPLQGAYSEDPLKNIQAKNVQEKCELASESPTWSSIYCLATQLTMSMLSQLRHSFLQDALNYVGVHQERMHKSLERVKQVSNASVLQEAEVTCYFIAELAHYSRQWRLQLPQVLNTLLTSMCYLMQTCVSFLIRPKFLQHVLEFQRHSLEEKSTKTHRPIEQMLTPVRHLQQQTSTDDVDKPPQHLVDQQTRLLKILCGCLTGLRQFTPNLCEILFDQSMDLSEYDPFLGIGFSTPSIDNDTPPTFGTLVSGINVCVRFLQKLEPRLGSPVKSPASLTEPISIPKPIVMFVLENSLVLMMSQACRYLKEPHLSPRDKQLLKRELGAELNSFLTSLQRHLRRSGPVSPGGTVLASPTPGGATLGRSLSQTTVATTQDQDYFKLVDIFLKQVLR
ncbi:unnamed protein product, partial [Owenia fusiformis]